jgi:hypothetical protein
LDTNPRLFLAELSTSGATRLHKTESDLELAVWKRVVRSVLGEVAYATLAEIVARDLSKRSL